MQNWLDDFYAALDDCYAQGDQVRTERFLLDAAAQSGRDGSRAIAVYNELGSFYRGVGRYGQSLRMFEQARRLTAEQLGTACTQYATVLNNIAGAYRLTGAYDKAIELFRQAIAVYCREEERQSYAYASVLGNLSLAYRETGRIEQAIGCLQQSLALIEQMPGCEQEIAVAYNNLTALYHAAGDETNAMQCLHRALHAFEQCADEQNVHYAAGLNSLAAYLCTAGAYEQALAVYRRSLGYTKRFFGENVEFGLTCQNMCWVYKKMKRWERAVESLAHAQAIYTRLLGDEHDRTRAAADDLARLRKACGL